MRRILWFRRDLRTKDNPLLSLEGDVLPIFIFDPHILSSLDRNDRRVTFIYNTLLNLKSSLQKTGRDLAIFYGKPQDVFEWLLAHGHYDEVAASGDYDSYARERDLHISHLLPFHYLYDTYIFRPDELLKKDGTPYQVFTPFYNHAKRCFTAEHMREYLPVQQILIPFEYDTLHQISAMIDDRAPLTLESIGFRDNSVPEYQRSAESKLETFAAKIKDYAQDRDFISRKGCSDLGVDLRFGTLGIRELLRWIVTQKKRGIDTEPFFRQLIFRDFYAMLLYHFPHLSERNFRYPFAGIPNETYFRTFCSARTGVPIVDAGVRELLQSGKMENRVRMICASFFTKNLLLPWQWGEAFFARYLIDYDASSNILSWQWSAGTGVDPQPYFRIFNPYTQTKKFDPQGIYIFRWIPELKSLPHDTLSKEEALAHLNLDHYPPPIVGHKISSQKALEYFHHVLK